MAFIKNKYPLSKTNVNHKDANKQNNTVSNLEWVTYKENMEHAVKYKLVATGEQQGQSKLSKEDVNNIRFLYKSNNYSQRYLAKKYSVCQRTIAMIINNITWKD